MTLVFGEWRGGGNGGDERDGEGVHRLEWGRLHSAAEETKDFGFASSDCSVAIGRGCLIIALISRFVDATSGESCRGERGARYEGIAHDDAWSYRARALLRTPNMERNSKQISISVDIAMGAIRFRFHNLTNQNRIATIHFITNEWQYYTNLMFRVMFKGTLTF